jgi:uncharacterized protein YndB with AHSA1/START domain
MTDAVRVTRTIDATPQVVFDAWVDPAQLQQWFCPGPAVLGEAQCDPVVGGQYRLVMVSPHGASQIAGEYLVVDPPRRLVFTWRSSTVGPESQVSVLFEPAGGGTRMTILHEGIPTEGPRSSITSGWTSVAGKLARLVATPHHPS